METIVRVTSLFIMSSALMFFSHCGDKPGPAPETDAKRHTQLLTASPWNVQTVLVDAVDKTAVYKNLKITFSATGFTTSNGGSVWPATGTWQFTDESGKLISRSDGLLVDLTEISSTKLVFGFAWSKTTLDGGRIGSVAGQHVFTFGK